MEGEKEREIDRYTTRCGAVVRVIEITGEEWSGSRTEIEVSASLRTIWFIWNCWSRRQEGVELVKCNGNDWRVILPPNFELQKLQDFLRFL